MKQLTANWVVCVGSASLAACSGALERGENASSDTADISDTSSFLHAHHSRPRDCHPLTGAGGGPVHDGGGGGEMVRISITPDATGQIDAARNSLGVEGPWYPFADGYDIQGMRGGSCRAAGHADADCSTITSPDPSVLDFPNAGGRMCVSGTVAQVLLANGTPDWGNMWGAGIGFDLNRAGTDAASRGPYNAAAHGVVGISFDIDAVPQLGLRVELPTPATAGTGIQPYWGAAAFYPNSPVQVGPNTFYFTDVFTPETTPQTLDTTRIQSVQFHLPSSQTSAEPFAFCISNVAFLVAK